jgi:two-component system sensor histidine kinase RegB
MADWLRINASWLLKLRWAAVLGQLATILTVAIALGVDLPLVALVAVVGLAAVTNLALAAWYLRVEQTNRWRQWTERGAWVLDAVITLDILLLAALLYWSGGAENPFSVFFLVNLALAAVIVQSEWIWAIGALSIVCFAALFIWRTPLPILDSNDPSLSFSGATTVKNEGTIVAVGASTVAILYFIVRLTRELRARDRELEEARKREARRERLESLATLAAGAAHELATPLSTIAVVAKELERHLESRGADADAVQDTKLIRKELAHCRAILDRMAGRAGESVGESPVELSVAEMTEEFLSGLPSVERVSAALGEASTCRLFAPKLALGQAIRGIVKNALDASGPLGRVYVSAGRTNSSVVFEIRDTGPGMSPEVLERAGEPFFTTKQPGEGTGLGLFLARAVVERLGGRVELSSEAGKGTLARIILPRKAGDAPAA